jgi:hypothetical protein
VARDAERRGLEEELGPLGLVDTGVEVATAGRLRLVDARVAAPVVRDAGRPHLLAFHGRQEIVVVGTPDRRSAEPRGLDDAEGVGRAEELVPVEGKRETPGGFLEDDGLRGPVELHATP